MMRTPDGHSKLELTKYHNPAAVGAEPENPPPNTLGLHRVMFAVDDIDDTVARLRAHGAELLGEVAQYLRRCVIELGARPEVPTSGNRPGINLNPPVGVRGARLASIYVPSGRVAFRDIAPSEVGDFEGAEIVENNRVPDHVKIYLNTEQDVDRAMVLTKAVLERR